MRTLPAMPQRNIQRTKPQTQTSDSKQGRVDGTGKLQLTINYGIGEPKVEQMYDPHYCAYVLTAQAMPNTYNNKHNISSKNWQMKHAL